MFGAHLSIAGGMVNALERALQLRMDCVQVFTKNQRQWRAAPLEECARQAWLDRLKELGWRVSDGPARVVAHNSYLINMASPDPTLHRRSIDAQRTELERCEALEIPMLVAHPGAHMGPALPAGEPHDLHASPTRYELAGLKRIVRALDAIHRDLPGCRTVTCLETTVGSGSNLGYAFHHLSWIRNAVREPDRVGFCLDTCHVTAAGHDMSTGDQARAVLEQFDAECGMDHLHVLHMNDSRFPAGSRRDRHAHIGDGLCGKSCFRAIVNHTSLVGVPKILETPKEETPKGTSYDVLNVRRLKRLIDSPRSADRALEHKRSS